MRQLSTDELPTVAELETMFLTTMAHFGYASGSFDSKQLIKPHQKLEGWKIIEVDTPFKNGTVRFTDQWSDKGGYTTLDLVDSDYSLGLWAMQYEGHYPKTCIPFLQRALKHAYSKDRKFYGGRGPYSFRPVKYERGQPSWAPPTRVGEIRYWNNAAGQSFRRFSGKEAIDVAKKDSQRNLVWVAVGSHTSWGGTFIPLAD